MQKSLTPTNSQLLPKGFAREYDVHVYYRFEDEAECSAAITLRDRAMAQLPQLIAPDSVFVGRMIDYPIGPHPTAMFEINFARRDLGPMLLWLIKNRGLLTVLVHEVSGNDRADHSQGAIWLGPPVLLDFSQFDSQASSM